MIEKRSWQSLGEVDLVQGQTPFLHLLKLRRDREATNYQFSRLGGWYNYTEVIRTPFSLNLNDVSVAHFLGEHMKSIEYKLLLGARYSTYKVPGRIDSFTGGVAFFCPPRRFVSEGEMDEDIAKNAMKFGAGGYINGGQSWKWGLAPQAYLDELVAHRGGVADPGGSTITQTFTEGTRVTWYKLEMVAEPRRAFVLDMNHLRLARHSGRFLLHRVQENSQEFLSDVGLDMDIPQAHTVYELP